MNDLATWYETGNNKIAVVRGGKFVGKTWAVTDFAMGFFEDHIIVDMNKQTEHMQVRRGDLKSFMPSLPLLWISMILKTSCSYLTTQKTAVVCCRILFNMQSITRSVRYVLWLQCVDLCLVRKSAQTIYACMS